MTWSNLLPDRKAQNFLLKHTRARSFLTFSHRISRLPEYQYNELAKGYIRILRLLPGKVKETLVCELIPIPLAGSTKFEALSYVWGDPTVTDDILCGGQRISVTINLRDALLRLRDTHEVRLLWADAICVNQKDLAEKEAQVQLMGSIYWHAAVVNVWLGQEEEKHEVALDAINEIVDIHFRPEKELCQDKNELGFCKSKSMPGYFMSTRHYGAADLISSREEQMKWEAIRQFFELPWFTRVWVVQEVGLACDATFYCGKSSMPLLILEAFLEWISFGGSTILRYFLIDTRLLTMVESYRNTTRRQGQIATIAQATGELVDVSSSMPSFFDILDQARGLRSTDPRDMVFAFLGHPSAMRIRTHETWLAADNSTHLDTRETILRPDYTKDTIETFRNAAIAFLKLDTKDVNILEYVAHDRQTIKAPLPSWVPQWHVTAVPARFRAEAKHMYRASGSLPPASHCLISRSVLLIKAFPISSIRFLWRFPGSDSFNILNNLYIVRDNRTPESDLNPVEYLWRAYSNLGHKPPLQDVVSFGKTLTAGLRKQDPEQDPDWHAQVHKIVHDRNFCAYRREKAAIWGPEFSKEEDNRLRSGGDADVYLEDLQRACANRAFFQTEDGHIGLGPKILNEGDECWLPVGARTPFILRRVDGDFKVLGQAYVEGIMMGEVANSLIVEDVKEIALI